MHDIFLFSIPTRAEAAALRRMITKSWLPLDSMLGRYKIGLECPVISDSISGPIALLRRGWCIKSLAHLPPLRTGRMRRFVSDWGKATRALTQQQFGRCEPMLCLCTFLPSAGKQCIRVAKPGVRYSLFPVRSAPLTDMIIGEELLSSAERTCQRCRYTWHEYGYGMIF